MAAIGRDPRTGPGSTADLSRNDGGKVTVVHDGEVFSSTTGTATTNTATITVSGGKITAIALS